MMLLLAAGSLLDLSFVLLLEYGFPIAFVIAMHAGAWKVFAKAGRPGWACLVPGYNLLVAFQIADLSSWWLLLPLLVLLPSPEPVKFAAAWGTLGLLIWFNTRLARRFGEGVHIAIGLSMMAPLFWCWLGFGDAKYQAETKST
jgi:hypothetical protein